ncbi:OmpW family protein [Methylotenera sp.]|uniref:OmpW/AlkL family protein n=1 Tax=Methylotenera sp. TaxID=2051956 RepID=UPI002728B52A|nr:OmpW family outer membrane protein [Methylotenera sp.]MDO9126070.1 OmpW family outer membrane protein [Parvibaculum sp.]MDP2231124.1 OmpW family outer membrane protein [Methylotenera sp.]MDP3142040.1 OmpW family outer membrane protein [Methylotenera sp.]
MKKSLLVLALATAIAPTFAMAEAGDIVVRLRATHVNPSESSNLGRQTDATYGGVPFSAAVLYGDANAQLQVGSNTIPEIDFSYYITKNIAAELILALGTRHDVKVSSAGAVNPNLGSVNLLPPTLTAQWHFMPDTMIDPYVGAGVAFVLGMDRSLTANAPGVGSFPIRVDRNNWGGVIQAGFDINLQDKWLVNFDVKKLWVSTDVELDLGTGFKKIDSLDIDPWVVSIGIGKKF